METVHEIKPNFIQKIFGAKKLKLNIKNYLISVSHNKNNQFDQKKITNIKLKKGIFFNDIDVVFEKSIQKINKLTKNQSNYYIFYKLLNLKYLHKLF